LLAGSLAVASMAAPCDSVRQLTLHRRLC
jgi:hypothetical protein